MTGLLYGTGRSVLFASILMAAVLLVGTGIGTVAAQSAPDCSTVSYNGEGTGSNPYEVGNVDQLQCIKEQELGANYVQVADIDASETEEWNGGDGFDPIGEANLARDTEFTGTFDGANHTISGLTIDRGSTNDVGLFGVVQIGRLENVSLENVDITGSSSVGGLVGLNDAAGTVTESYASGSVIGDQAVGGLAGYNYRSTVEMSYMNGGVSGARTVGGLVGINLGGNVENSYATGDVFGTDRAAGLVGHNFLGGKVRRSYATGNVSGDSEVGGLVGENNEDSTVIESYWNEETTGQPTSAGGTGLTAAEITGSAARGNMTAFDFMSTWVTVPRDYPLLAWQQPTSSFTLSTNSPAVDEAITFNGSTSSDRDGSIQTYEWDFDSDGNTDTTTRVPLATHTYSNPGTFTVTLTVTDNDGATATTTQTVSVGEGMPGFTTTTALLALLTVVAAAVRRETK